MINIKKSITDADSHDERMALVNKMPEGTLKCLWEMLLRAEYHGMQIGREDTEKALAGKIKLAELGAERFSEGYHEGQKAVVGWLEQFFQGHFLSKHPKVEEAFSVIRGWITEDCTTKQPGRTIQ